MLSLTIRTDVRQGLEDLALVVPACLRRAGLSDKMVKSRSLVSDPSRRPTRDPNVLGA